MSRPRRRSVPRGRRKWTDMLFCGLKLTHDGGVALVEDGRLVTSVEVEKLDNGLRYAELGDLDVVEQVLAAEGVELADVDAFAVDGWGYGEAAPSVLTAAGGRPVTLRVAPYREETTGDSLAPHAFDGLTVGQKQFPYRSYHHT